MQSNFISQPLNDPTEFFMGNHVLLEVCFSLRYSLMKQSELDGIQAYHNVFPTQTHSFIGLCCCW
jgi:hypothetical protein